ncbi:MAG: hypothetical protein HQL82_04460 [Magnetococcales bacterium]|nr:hypothetical protein [Magnetococcales bacterium]
MRNQDTWLALALLAAVLMPTSAQGQEERLRDPTRPPTLNSAGTFGPEALKKAQRPPDRLDALLIGPQRRLAVVNGRLVRVGDRVDEALVKSITPAGVQVLRQGRLDTLTPPVGPKIVKEYPNKGTGP